MDSFNLKNMTQETESLHKGQGKEENKVQDETAEDLIKGSSIILTTKKSIAQGLLDLALLTQNITQLKHIILIGDLHPFHILLLWSISLSLFLQVILGLLLMVLLFRNLTKLTLQRLNNAVYVIIFLITILNVIISVFNDESISRKYRDCLKRTALEEACNHSLIANATLQHPI